MRRWASIGVWLWAALCVLLVASLMVTHTYALPTPSPQALKVAPTGHWQLLHVLYSRCRCSQRVLDHLFARKALPGVEERIVLVGEAAGDRQRALEAGYAVELLTPVQLRERYALSAVPALAVVSPEGRVAYLGGYTERKQGPDVEDVAIYQRARAGASPLALPLFGCAVSESLRAKLDPLSLRAWVLGD